MVAELPPWRRTGGGHSVSGGPIHFTTVGQVEIQRNGTLLYLWIRMEDGHRRPFAVPAGELALFLTTAQHGETGVLTAESEEIGHDVPAPTADAPAPTSPVPAPTTDVLRLPVAGQCRNARPPNQRIHEPHWWWDNADGSMHMLCLGWFPE